jgi:hypothetical protein
METHLVLVPCGGCLVEAHHHVVSIDLASVGGEAQVPRVAHYGARQLPEVQPREDGALRGTRQSHSHKKKN